MKASQRREALAQTLKQASSPLKANTLAEEFGVSRQIIVGDVAILRASDNDIIATNQGYILKENIATSDGSRYRGKIVCQHEANQAEEELAIIVNHGGWVENVEVDHPYYGSLRATLKIQSQKDIEDFLQEMSHQAGGMLSSLTNGIHIHTITANDEASFKEIKIALQAAGILLDETI